jgi:hypothetical protein
MMRISASLKIVKFIAFITQLKNICTLREFAEEIFLIKEYF